MYTCSHKYWNGNRVICINHEILFNPGLNSWRLRRVLTYTVENSDEDLIELMSSNVEEQESVYMGTMNLNYEHNNSKTVLTLNFGTSELVITGDEAKKLYALILEAQKSQWESPSKK